jgi:hypothetical protein
MKSVPISKNKPPKWILDEVKKQFGVLWESGVIFTYNGVISNCKGEMTEDLLAHEGNHIKQQAKIGADNWWKKYFEDPQFRYQQELECYRKQYQWIKKNIQDRNEVFRHLMHYAKSLSSEMYGNIKTTQQAYLDIKN